MKPAQTKTELLNECGQVVLWVVVLMCHCVVCFPVACTGIHIRTPFPARLKKKVSTGITRVLNRLPLHSLHSHNLFEMWSRFPLHGQHSWHSWPSGLDYRETGMGRTDRHDGWKKRKESWAGAPVRAGEVNLCLSKEGFLRSPLSAPPWFIWTCSHSVHVSLQSRSISDSAVPAFRVRFSFKPPGLWST